MERALSNPMAAVTKYFSISMVFSLLGFIFGIAVVPARVVFIANKLVFILFIALIFLSVISRNRGRGLSSGFSMNWVYLFTFIEGILIYPIVVYYMQSMGVSMVFNVLVGTLIIFAILSMVAAKNTDGKFLSFGKSLFISIIVILALSVVNLFLGNSFLSVVISAVSVFIFSLYVLYDISLIKYRIAMNHITSRDDLSIHVLNLFLDFINIFTNLLSIVNSTRD